MTTLFVRDNSGFKEALFDDVIAQARQMLARRFRSGSAVLQNGDLTRDFLQLHLGSLDHEVFGVLHLDSRRRLIAVQDLFRGTLDNASVHPREVVKAALGHNSASIILFHNHPSGDAEPSEADRRVTRRLVEALALVDIRVLDHFIIGERVYSFAEAGRL